MNEDRNEGFLAHEQSLSIPDNINSPAAVRYTPGSSAHLGTRERAHNGSSQEVDFKLSPSGANSGESEQNAQKGGTSPRDKYDGYLTSLQQEHSQYEVRLREL